MDLCHTYYDNVKANNEWISSTMYLYGLLYYTILHLQNKLLRYYWYVNSATHRYILQLYTHRVCNHLSFIPYIHTYVAIYMAHCVDSTRRIRGAGGSR